MKNKKVCSQRKAASKVTVRVASRRKTARFSGVVLCKKFLKKVKKRFTLLRKLWRKGWKVARRGTKRVFRVHKVAVFAGLFGLASVFAAGSLVEFGKASVTITHDFGGHSREVHLLDGDYKMMEAIYRDCVEKTDMNSDGSIGTYD